MLDIALEIPLPALLVGGLVQRDDAGLAGVQVLHEALDRAALAGRVAPLEQHHELLARLRGPFLYLQKLGLKLGLLRLVGLPAELGAVGIFSAYEGLTDFRLRGRAAPARRWRCGLRGDLRFRLIGLRGDDLRGGVHLLRFLAQVFHGGGLPGSVSLKNPARLTRSGGVRLEACQETVTKPGMALPCRGRLQNPISRQGLHITDPSPVPPNLPLSRKSPTR